VIQHHISKFVELSSQAGGWTDWEVRVAVHASASLVDISPMFASCCGEHYCAQMQCGKLSRSFLFLELSQLLWRSFVRPVAMGPFIHLNDVELGCSGLGKFDWPLADLVTSVIQKHIITTILIQNFVEVLSRACDLTASVAVFSTNKLATIGLL